jgi:hypothetical protein
MFNARRAFLATLLLCLILGIVVACSSKSNDGTSGTTTTGLGTEKKFVAVSWNGSSVICDPDPVHLLRNTQKAVWEADSEIRIVLETKPPENVPCVKASTHWRCTSRTFANREQIKYDASIMVGGVWKTADPMIDIGP